MKYIIPLIAVCLFVCTTGYAQTEKKTKIVIEKEIEENGETTIERIELEGEEAEEYLKNNEEEEIQVDVEVDEMDNGSKKVWITRNGKKEEIILPEGEDYLFIQEGDDDSEKIEIKNIEGKDGEKHVRIEIKKEKEIESKGKKKKMIIKSSDDQDLLKELEMEDIDPDDIETIDVIKNDGSTEITIKLKDGKVIKKKMK